MMLRKKLPGIAAAVVGALSLALLPGVASAHSPGSNHVDLREHACCGIGWGDIYDAYVSRSTMPAGWDNKVSSLWVWSPVDSITIYSGTYYTGDSLNFVYGTDHLGGYGYNFNDRTKSYILYW